jgi:hypothetical protein
VGGLVWIASYPKSGNTWTRSFLHRLLAEDGEQFDINEMNRLTTWDSAALWYQPMLPGPLQESSKEEVASVRPRANQRIADDADELVFVKTHNAMVADRGTPMVNPKVTAGAIYIVRNPLDIAVSYSFHLGRGIDDTISYMNRRGVQTNNNPQMAYEVQSSWREHLWTWTRKPSPSLFVMRYEDLLARPREVFGALARFLRVRVSRPRLERAIEESSFERLQAQESEKGFAEKPETAEAFFRAGKSEQWRAVLTPLQIAAVVDANRDLMQRFGYLPEEL